jgi:hypothetical protein
MLRSVSTILGVIVLSGCVTIQTEFGVVHANAENTSMKMLRPGARVRACRSSLFGIPLQRATHGSLVVELLGADAEADVATHVRVVAESITTGIYNRTCLELAGNLGREISEVRLPVVGEHEHHH